jgi:predicted dehydrogenase
MSSEQQINQSIGVGVIGYGFMGSTHAKAYQSAQRDGYPCRLIAIADPASGSLGESGESDGNIKDSNSEVDFSGITHHQQAKELIERADVDLVSICTHTDSHVELTIAAIEAGKHVLVEKPIAIRPEEVQRLAAIANRSDLVCMPAMCMRFWPAWVRMHEMIQSGTYGAVRSAVFERLGTRPGWATEFYSDDSRTGGVLYDLHIHDTDFIIHCFGTPDAVTTTGDGMHLSTTFHYAGAPLHVLAHAAWDHQPAVGFQMRCTVVCEQATVDFDINRDDQLILHVGETSTPIDVGTRTGYDGEVRHMLDLISNQESRCRASMDDAATVSSVLDAQNRSMNSGARVSLT